MEWDVYGGWALLSSSLDYGYVLRTETVNDTGTRS